MNDRELLKAAAKAAGYPAGRHVAMDGLLMANDLYWNPLTDDGDALRLASLLLIDLLFDSDDGGYVTAWWDKRHEEKWLREDDTGNFPQAVRRAITRAAAEIGKNMET